MARPGKGILGGFSGKVGTVIGSTWKGISYMRSLPAKKKNRKRTEAQLVQQVKFAMAADFYRSLSNLLVTSFQPESERTGRNAAVSTLLNKAIGGVYPNFFLDYSKILVARGALLSADNPAVASMEPGKLTFSWTDDSGLGNATSSDKAILVAYESERNVAIFTVDGPIRADREAVLNVPYFTGKLVHTWLSFRSADGKRIANSVYAGSVQVQ